MFVSVLRRQPWRTQDYDGGQDVSGQSRDNSHSRACNYGNGWLCRSWTKVLNTSQLGIASLWYPSFERTYFSIHQPRIGPSQGGGEFAIHASAIFGIRYK